MHTFVMTKSTNDQSHIKPRSFLVRLGLAGLLTVPCVFLQPVDAEAALISPDLTISGQVLFDSGFASAAGRMTQSGSFSKTIGGTTTSSTFNGAIVSGPNPQVGILTDTGDGFAMTAETSAFYESEFALGMDVDINIANSSADDYRVTFKINFDNSVDANTEPLDAYVDSEFSVSDAGGEVFFTYLSSDSLYGDNFNDTDPGTFGAFLNDNGETTFDVILNANSTSYISAFWTMDGGAYDPGSEAFLDFAAAITVDEIENLSAVPVPAAIYLFGTGLSGLAAVGMRRKKAKKS